MKFIKNKKAAITLSVNMLVVIILAIVIFSSGVYFLYNIMGKAFQLKGTIEEDLDKRVEIISCDKPVCFVSNYKKIYRGEFEIIGLRIYNNQEGNVSFTVSISPAVPRGYDKEGGVLTDTLYYVIGTEIPNEREITIDSHKEKGIGIGIEVPKDAKSGIYVFDINVEADNVPYYFPQQIRIEVP